MLEIDGSLGEGGGQILRSSLALSLLTGQSFHLRRIRANRPKSGLQPQHLASVRAAKEIGSAEVVGDSAGSSDLTFIPGEVTSGKYHFRIGTAGATGLVLHAVCYPLLLRGNGESDLIITGGTHVSTSPSFDYLDLCWKKWLQLFGLKIELELKQPGFYPRGGGMLQARILPGTVTHGLNLLERGDPGPASIVSISAGLPEHVATRQMRRAEILLRNHGIRSESRREMWPEGPGSILLITFPECPVPNLFFGLGARGKPAENVAEEAVKDALLWYDSGMPVEEHSADQILLPLLFAPESSAFAVSRISEHLRTNIQVVQQFMTRRIDLEGEVGSTGIVRIGPPGIMSGVIFPPDGEANDG